MNLQRTTSVFVALLLSVFLLAIPIGAGGGYEVITDFKYRLFLLICGGYIAAVALIRLQLAVTGIQPVRNLKKQLLALHPALKLILLFWLFVIVSAIASPHPGVFVGQFWQEGVLSISIYIVSCFFLAKYVTPQKWMLFLLAVSALLFSLLSLMQLTGANPFTLYPPGHNFYGAGIYYSGKFIGTIGNAGLSATFLSLAVGVLSMATIKFEFKERWWIAIALLAGLLLIFEMGVYAAMVAVVIGMLLMLPVAVNSRRTLSNTLIVLSVYLFSFLLSQLLLFGDGYLRFGAFSIWLLLVLLILIALAVITKKCDMFDNIAARNYRIAAIIFSIAAIFGILLFVLLQDREYGGMIYEASQFMRGRADDSFGTRRIYIWRNMLEHMSWNTLLFGTGPDTLGHWAIPPFSRYFPELGRTLTSTIDAAHNEYLHILAMNGLFAFLAYTGALVVAAVKWYKTPENHLSAVAGAGMLFYCIQAFFGISHFITAPFFWTCFAILIYSQTNWKYTSKHNGGSKDESTIKS